METLLCQFEPNNKDTGEPELYEVKGHEIYSRLTNNHQQDAEYVQLHHNVASIQKYLTCSVCK